VKNYNIANPTHIIKSNPATIVLFGAGSIGRLALYTLKQFDIKTDYFCDNDKQKQGTSYCGIKVISPKELSALSPDTHIFMCNSYITTISTQLERMNFKNVYGCAILLEDVDFSAMDLGDYEGTGFRIKDVERLLWRHKRELQIDAKPLDIKYIEIAITERCSMKCIDCANLMQYYVNPKHNDLDLLFKSMDRLMECVDVVNEVRVLGGEPFVNKDIYKIVSKLVSYDKLKNVVIYTNATIVPKDEKLSCFKNNKVKFDITNYGQLSRNHDKMIEVLETNNIKYVTHVATTWTDSGRIEYREKTEDELSDMFMNCCVSDGLNILNGKLYICPFSANAHNLDAIPFNSDDVIDLANENEDIATLKTKLAHFYTKRDRKNYLTACTYCKGRAYNTPKIKAGIQTKEILPLPV